MREAGSRGPQAILWGGLVAGTLDITAAFISSGLRGVSPVRVLHAVASGLIGKAAAEGGAATAALGLGLHFLIAFGAATVFWLASRKLTWMVRQPVVAGLLYGIAVYLFMNVLVLPLSAIAFTPSRAPGVIATQALIIMFCVGLPIALIESRFSSPPSPAASGF
jgi:hypothetical protein